MVGYETITVDILFTNFFQPLTKTFSTNTNKNTKQVIIITVVLLLNREQNLYSPLSMVKNLSPSGLVSVLCAS